jgi:hypothetical protein
LTNSTKRILTSYQANAFVSVVIGQISSRVRLLLARIEDLELRYVLDYITKLSLFTCALNAFQIPELERPATNHERLLEAKEQPHLLHALGDAAITLASCSQDVSSRSHVPGEAELEKDGTPSASFEGPEDLCLSYSDDMVGDFDVTCHLASDSL